MHEDELTELSQAEWDEYQSEQVTQEMDAAWGPAIMVEMEGGGRVMSKLIFLGTTTPEQDAALIRSIEATPEGKKMKTYGVSGLNLCPFCGSDECKHFVGWTQDGKRIEKRHDGNFLNMEEMLPEDIVVNTGVTARVYRRI